MNRIVLYVGAILIMFAIKAASDEATFPERCKPSVENLKANCRAVATDRWHCKGDFDIVSYCIEYIGKK